jgi:hypothetical protein
MHSRIDSNRGAANVSHQSITSALTVLLQRGFCSRYRTHEGGANLEERRHPTVQLQSPVFALTLLLDCPDYPRTAPMNITHLEAECIVFAAEGLLLPHDFISDDGIRVQSEISEFWAPPAPNGRLLVRQRLNLHALPIHPWQW